MLLLMYLMYLQLFRHFHHMLLYMIVQGLLHSLLFRSFVYMLHRLDLLLMYMSSLSIVHIMLRLRQLNMLLLLRNLYHFRQLLCSNR